MIRDANLLNSGKTNRSVPISEILSAEATLRSFISLASTFSLTSSSAKSRCPFLLSCGKSQMRVHMLVYLPR